MPRRNWYMRTNKLWTYDCSLLVNSHAATRMCTTQACTCAYRKLAWHEVRGRQTKDTSRFVSVEANQSNAGNRLYSGSLSVLKERLRAKRVSIDSGLGSADLAGQPLHDPHKRLSHDYHMMHDMLRPHYTIPCTGQMGLYMWGIWQVI